MKAALLALLISFSAFADYKSEMKAIEKFELDEYLNQKNYPPIKPGEIPEINKAGVPLKKWTFFLGGLVNS